jgi:hypothetical protein
LHQTKHTKFLLKHYLLAPCRGGEPRKRQSIAGFGMNLIAGNGHRKWPYGCPAFARAVVVTGFWLLLGLQAEARPASRDDLFGDGLPKLRGTVHRLNIPLPRPRPAEAPAAEPEDPVAAKSGTPSEKPAERANPAAPALPQPSECRAALTGDMAIAPSIPDIQGAGGCGGTDLVKLEAIVLPDKHRVAVTPAATLRCSMASAIADWVRTDIAPLTAKLGSEISVLDNFDSYECRGFNRIPGAHLSEHGRANALDVRAFKLADGRSISLTDRGVSRELRETVLHSVCTRFMTVLGPGSDWYHEDHIHLDLAERRNNYRICQWNVYDPMPQVAPLMPAERPEEAPPREIAAKSDGVKGKPDAKAGSGGSQDADEDGAAAEPPPVRKQAIKKRR